MKNSTKERKKVIKGVQEAHGKQWVTDQMYQIFAMFKQGFDAMMNESAAIGGDRGDTDPASAEGSCVAKEDTAFDQSYREHVFDGKGCN